MTETDTPPARGLKTRGPKTRALGLLGMWLCAVALFPLLAVWMGFFHPRRPLHLPSVGSPKFWPMVGLDVLVASLMTLSAWSDRNKPSRRRATSPATPKDRLRRGLAGAGILAFLILRVLAANPGAAVNWPGVLGGAAALALLFVLLLRCAALAQPPPAPPPMGEEAGGAAPTSLPWPPPPAPLGVRPPNRYRAEVSAREVVYHRPPARIGAWVGVLFFVTMFVGSLGFALLGLGLVFVPGMHMRENPAMALMMGGGAVFFVCAALSILAMTGPRVLRVSPSDRTYTYRVSAPLRWPVMRGIVGAANRDELGLPWRISEYRGDVGDMAGIQMRETIYKSSTAYSLFLRWRDPARPSLRVGYAVTEDKARALQAQAADDLGVLMLPDETDGKLTE